MNINQFPLTARVVYQKRLMGIGGASITCELPKAMVGVGENATVLCDFHNAKFIDMRTMSDQFRREHGVLVHQWMGILQENPDNELSKILLLCLEFEEWPDNRWYMYRARVPPGRAGLNATMLVDQNGKLVSQVPFSNGSTVRLLLFSPKRNAWGWSWLHPTVAIQFVNATMMSKKRDFEV